MNSQSEGCEKDVSEKRERKGRGRWGRLSRFGRVTFPDSLRLSFKVCDVWGCLGRKKKHDFRVFQQNYLVVFLAAFYPRRKRI